MFADKYASQVGEIPKEPHFAILKTASVHVEGDERSRTHPGHGYPARTEYYINYEAYLTREKWEAAIAELENRTGFPTPYVAIEARPAKVKRTVHVENI